MSALASSTPVRDLDCQFLPLQRVLPGLALSAALALAGMRLDRVGWLHLQGFGPLTLAIVLGMLVGNTVYPRHVARHCPGVNFSKAILLRLGVVLYGLRLTVQDLGQIGFSGVLIDALVLGSTFGLAWFAGTRLLGLDRKLVMLIGAGSSICGAAAVMATEPVVRGRAEQVTVAIATVVTFGTLATLLYPALFALNQHWSVIPGGAQGFGIYIGSTVHEVAQVLATAHSVAGNTADSAVIAKMVRVMMLAPFLLLLSVWLARDAARHHALSRKADAPPGETCSRAKIHVPWFAFAFIATVQFNSLHWLPTSVLPVLLNLDTLMLAMAMAALGLSTQLGALRAAGFKPVVLGLILFAWLAIGGALINHWVPALLR